MVSDNWRKEIENCITDLGLSYRKFGKLTGITYSELFNVVKSNRGLSVKAAVKLERFGLKTAEYWLNKQTIDQIKKANDLQNEKQR